MKLKRRIASSILAAVMAFTPGVSTYGFSSVTTYADEAVVANVSANATATSIDYGQQDNIQDGVILHCWNWSYNNIKKYIPQIAAAGYTAVQTSPVTQPKDYYWNDIPYANVGIPDGLGGHDGNWWKSYQPVTASICDNGHTWYGTKAEFKAMCDEAEKYGVKVIVDIVANHMGNIKGWKIGSVEEVMGDISPQVGEFWNTDMLTDSSYWHISTSWVHSSDGRFDVTQGNMGMPDLNTGDKKVQTMILNLLKECIDNGADGFRFDAAKHIETPADDPAFASDFWDVVLDGATSYAQSTKGFTPYYYGEVLNRIDSTAAENYYISKMSLTDNSTSDNIRNSLKYGQISSASNPSYCGYVHGRGDRVVLWAESHDTYMGGGSSYDVNDSTINKAWAIIASRKDSTALYFARPFYSYERLIDDQNGYDARKDPAEIAAEIRQTQLGEVGTLTWMDTCVAEVNRFRNNFVGQSESLGNVNDTIFYNVRGNSGVVIVNTKGAGDVSISLGGKMKDGTYTDQVTGNKFTVSGGTISGTIGNEDGIAVIYNTTSVPRNTIEAPRENFAYESIDITVGLANATSGTYSINGGKAVTYTKEANFTIGTGDPIGTKYDVVLTATDGTKTTSSTFTFTKESKNVNPVDISCSKKDGAKFSTDGMKVIIEAANADSASYKLSTDNKEVSFTQKTEITVGQGLNIGDTVTLTITGTNDKGTVTKTFTFTKVEEKDVTDTIVYFKNSVGWSNIHAYAWSTVDGETVKNAEWPGQEMECIDSDNKVYALDLGDSFEKIVFNNGGKGSQTGNLTCTPGCIYDENTGIWSEYETVNKGTVTVKYVDAAGNEIASFSQISGTVGETYTTSAKTIDGYTLKTTPANATGTYTQEDITVIYVYEKNSVTPLTGSLKVNGSEGTVNLTKGDSVTLVPTAAGGTAPYTYQYVMKVGTSSITLKNYSTAASYTGPLTSAGTKVFTVNVKDNSGTVVATNSVTVVVSSGTTTLSASLKVNGQSGTVNLNKGDSVTLVPTATGGTGSYTYQYLMKTSANGTNMTLKNYSAATSYTGPLTSAGTKIFTVNVKDSSGTIVASNSVTVVVTAATQLSASLKVNGFTGTINLTKGESVTLVPTATGGTGTYTYQYLMKTSTNGTNMTLKNYSSATSYTGPLTTVGTKIFTVNVKDSAGTVVATNSVTVVVTAAAELSTSLKVNGSSSQVNLQVGDSVILTPEANGGTGSYTYKYEMTNATTGVTYTLKNYSSATSYTGPITSKGTKVFKVYVKDTKGTVVETNTITVVVK